VPGAPVGAVLGGDDPLPAVNVLYDLDLALEFALAVTQTHTHSLALVKLVAEHDVVQLRDLPADLLGSAGVGVTRDPGW
jgi:hypothetical protein